jgi:hypothetical protein
VLLPALLVLFSFGCTYQSSTFGDLQCENEGETRGDDVCRGGVWVSSGNTTPILDMDMTFVDMPDEGMMPDGMCTPESDVELCASAGAECGALPSMLDSCGVRRMPDCGVCAGDGNMCVNNQCSCVAETDQDLCLMAQATCGALVVMDSCGAERELDCGTCMGADEECDNNTCLVPCGDETSAELCMGASAQCGSITLVNSCGDQVTINCGQCQGDGERCAPNNVCFCEAETDAELCTDMGAQCGELMTTDICGTPRMINCGGCAGTDDICNNANQCECVPETDETFCGRNNAQCGTIVANDNCGVSRSVNCGGCDDGICQNDNTCSVCQPETNNQFCARLGKTCGEVSGMDNCGDPRTTTCGSCNNDRVCGGNNTCECPAPSCNNVDCGTVTNACNNTSDCGGCGNNEVCQTNQCVCAPETDAELCTANAATCGAITVQDRCAATRTVNCGTCSGGQICESGGNTCCSSESNTDFCQGAGAECGNISGTDNCGYPRSISCGGCGNNEICNGSNQCECVAETDQQLCQMAGAICGSLTVQDRCNATRTVSCGTCPTNNGRDNNMCDGGNQCVCTPYSDAEICTNAGATCGAVTGSDGCGNMKMVANCGGCGTDESCVNNACECDTLTCDPGFDCGSVSNACSSIDCGPNNGMCDTSGGNDNNTCVGNTCTCTPYSDAEICSNEGATCGAVTGSDGCGGMKMVADCGMCDTSGGKDNNACSNNQCVCTPYNAMKICGDANADCDSITANDGCGMMVSFDCGTCDTSNGNDNNTCSGNMCSCTPSTTQEICDAYGAANGGEACGNIGMRSDGCGSMGNVNCGNSCTAGVCTNNICTL